MANLYSVPLENGVQLTLQNALLTGETSTITFTGSVTSKLQASASMPGILVIDRVDANGNETPTKTEYISFTGVTGSTVTGLIRGLANTTDQDHAAGAIVELVPDVVWAEALNDVFTTQHNSDGTHKTLSNLSLASVTINNSILIGASLASITLTNFSFSGGINNVSLTSTTLTNSTIDAFTFKSPISNVTQGDIIAFNNNSFQRVTGTVNQILTMTSTASGLLPAFTDKTRDISFYTSVVSQTTGITTSRTLLLNSNISVSVNYPALVELNAYLDDSFNNTSGSWSYQFANASTLIDQNFPFRPTGAAQQTTKAIGALVSLASGNHVLSIQAITDGNTLTVFKGRFWVKVYPS